MSLGFAVNLLSVSVALISSPLKFLLVLGGKTVLASVSNKGSTSNFCSSKTGGLRVVVVTLVLLLKAFLTCVVPLVTGRAEVVDLEASVVAVLDGNLDPALREGVDVSDLAVGFPENLDLEFEFVTGAAFKSIVNFSGDFSSTLLLILRPVLDLLGASRVSSANNTDGPRDLIGSGVSERLLPVLSAALVEAVVVEAEVTSGFLVGLVLPLVLEACVETSV